jgi:biotin operon repressor
MKTIWQLTYEVIYEGIPRNGEQIKKYKSFAEAKKDIREIISKIYLSPYIKAIRTEGIHKAYRTAMADFLDNYISRTDFLNIDESIPSDDPDDYEFERKPTIKNDAGVSVDDDYWYDEDEETDEFDDFDISITRDSLFVKCHYEGYPELNTDMLVMDDETKEYYFHFNVDRAPKSKLREVQMTLLPLQYWGTSSYPLLILRTLENSQEPLDQQRIISHIEATNDTTIERKAIGRNITLLKDLGYDIQHNGDGYFIPKKAPTIEQEDFQAIVESVNANEALDDDKKRKLLDKLFEMQ